MAEPADDFTPRKEATAPPAPGLYIVATPIGNLGDLTFRARDTLAGVDLIACEDTRVTGRLLKAYGVSTSMVAYHDHNGAAMRPKLLEKLASGAAVALVSDAGTPSLADPGHRLIREARALGVPILAVPGPSALGAVLSLAPVAADKHAFLGFPPAKAQAKRKFFETYRDMPTALVLYESAKRLLDTLRVMEETLGDREAGVGRELTKRFEELRTGDLSALIAHYEEAPPKGEIVIVVAPGEETAPEPARLRGRAEALASEGRSPAEIAKILTRENGAPRKAAYDLALAASKGAAHVDETTR